LLTPLQKNRLQKATWVSPAITAMPMSSDLNASGWCVSALAGPTGLAACVGMLVSTALIATLFSIGI